MALVSGSPCYPPWRAMTGTWGSYVLPWRSLADRIAVAAVSAPPPEGASAFSLTVATPAAVSAADCTAAGGPLAAGGCTADAQMAAAAAAVLACSASSTHTQAAAAGCTGNVEKGAEGATEAFLVREANGSVLRISVIPAARMGRGRLTWRN